MPSSRWIYDQAKKRYRYANSGRLVRDARIVQLRHDFTAAQKDYSDLITHRLIKGDMTVRRWETEARARIKATYVATYMLGRGGKSQMTQSDYGRLGQMLRTQYEYLRDFAVQVKAGELSEAQILARLPMYFESATYAYEKGHEAAYGGNLVLPCHPGDGRTPCRIRCRCYWRISETKRQFRAYWVRTRLESCSGCISRGQSYSPFIQPKASA
jgi:hypothetical protein